MIKIIHNGKTGKQFHRIVCPVCKCDYVCDDEELVERKTDNYYEIMGHCAYYYEMISHCPWCGNYTPVKNESDFIQIPKNEDPEEYLLQYFAKS